MRAASTLCAYAQQQLLPKHTYSYNRTSGISSGNERVPLLQRTRACSAQVLAALPQRPTLNGRLSIVYTVEGLNVPWLTCQV